MEAFAWILASFILTGISAIILPYLWYLFWRLRHHFLISARFPKVTLSMSIAMFINSLSVCMNSYTLSMYDYNTAIASRQALNYPITLIAAMVLAWLFCAAIVYRAFLIYRRWVKSEQTFQNQSSIIVGGFNSESEVVTIDALRNTEEQSKQPQRTHSRVVTITLVISFAILILTVPGLIDENLQMQRQLFPLAFIVVIILGIYVLIKARKMKEAMLCNRETYLISSLAVFNILISNAGLPSYISFFLGLFLSMYIYYIFCAFYICLEPLFLTYSSDFSLRYPDCCLTAILI